MSLNVIMPGGFHPFHAGHRALYEAAKKAFPGANIYIAATNDTKTRPFPFTLKEKLARLSGVQPGQFIQVKSPFQPREITENLDPSSDVVVFVRSEKDKNEHPVAGGTKKDGTPGYFQPWDPNNMQAFGKHAHVAYLPTVEFGPGITSATEIRDAWPRLNDKRKQTLVMSLYPAVQKNPQLAKNVTEMFNQVLGGQPQVMAEGFYRVGINELTVNKNKQTHQWQLRNDQDFSLVDDVDSVILKDVEPVTGEDAFDSGSNVFAYLRGEKANGIPEGLTPFTIFFQRDLKNPFIDKDTGEPVEHADYVKFDKSGAVTGYKQDVTETFGRGINLDPMNSAKSRDLERQQGLRPSGPQRLFSELADMLHITGPQLQRFARIIPGFPEGRIRGSSTHGSKGYYDLAAFKRWVIDNQVREKIAAKKDVSESKDDDEFGADLEVQQLLRKAQQHYPHSQDKQQAFVKYAQRALKHSEEEDTHQDREIAQLQQDVSQIKAVVKKLQVTENADYLEEK